MKKILPSVFLFSFVVTMLVSCLPPTIDIDVKPAEPQLTVCSQTIGTQGIIVGLTKSYSPLDTSGNHDTVSSDLLNKILVSNALVTITHQNITDTLVMISPGLYLNLAIQLIDHESYTLHAKDPATGKEVFSTTTLEPRVNFDTVYPSIERTPEDTLVHFHYQLTDAFGEENYYVVNFVKKVQGDSTFDIGSIFAQGNNQVLSEFELIDDQAFDNGHLSKDVIVRSAGHTDTVAAVVSEITKGYYEFLTAFKRAGSFFNQLTGEPINYPSNVTGGYGYFTLYRRDSHVFDLNLY